MIPTKGAQPLWGVKHSDGDAVFALACNYDTKYYKRFVGTLRKAGFKGDIVLAVSPIAKMKKGVEEYLKSTGVVAYGFDVDCEGKDNCKLQDEFLGYPDPRPHRTFANIRYALYEYWLRYYSGNAYILILDFRDTFFQRNPFEPLGPIEKRKPTYDLRMYAENGVSLFYSFVILHLSLLKNTTVFCYIVLLFDGMYLLQLLLLFMYVTGENDR
jgi:hypothetical protein